MNNTLTCLFYSYKRLNEVLGAGVGDRDVRAFTSR